MPGEERMKWLPNQGNFWHVRYVLGQFPPHPTTQTGYISALQCFYDFLIQQRLRKDNPAKTIGRPPALKGTPRPLDLEECVRYEAAAIELGLVHEMIAVFGLYQGFRRSESRKSQWSWFFPADGELWCDVHGKGGKIKRDHVHRRTRETLDRVRRAHNDPVWVFPSRVSYGAPIGGTTVSRIHRDICESAGLPEKVTLHQLRHSYATYLGEIAGAPLEVVQLGMRHSDPRSTEIYMQLLPKKLVPYHERLTYGPPLSVQKAEG